LHRIVVNRALDLLRAERGTVGLERVGPVAAPERATADPELAAAIARLDADRRAVVALRYGLDYSLAQIAEVLSLPLGTVQSRLHRALAELRSLLEVDDAERS
jgi:RNA polymerase sigma-70 factor (ECF subfamily)